MPFDLGVLVLLKIWWSFFEEVLEDQKDAEDELLRRHLETMKEDDLRKLLDE